MAETAHGYLQWARGMCSDELPYPEIDLVIERAVEHVKDIEDERDRYRQALDDAIDELMCGDTQAAMAVLERALNQEEQNR